VRKIGAALVGTEAELKLKIRWMLPAHALKAGFKTKYPFLENAIKNIVGLTNTGRYKLLPEAAVLINFVLCCHHLNPTNSI